MVVQLVKLVIDADVGGLRMFSGLAATALTRIPVLGLRMEF